MAYLLARVLPATSAVVYVQVLDAQSQWNETHTKIVTKHRVAVVDALVGKPTKTVTVAETIEVQTDGGYLPDDEIGLWVSHDATLQPGRPLLLLLSAESDHYRVVGGELGIFTVAGGTVSHQELQLPTDKFVEILNTELARTGNQVILATSDLWTTAATRNGTNTLPLDHHAPLDDQPRWIVGSAELEIKVNLNSTQINDAERPRSAFYMAIAQALYTWSTVEGADFTLLYAGETDATETGYNGENEIIFAAEGHTKPLGQAQLWYTANNVILEVDMWINDNYDLSIAEQPAFGEIDLESIVLHELGHWVPLGHDSDADAVMYSVLAPQQVKRELTVNEIQQLSTLYPCPFAPCVHLDYQDELPTPTSTPTPNATPTLTLVPTRITPTIVPTKAISSTYPVYLPFVAR